MAAQDVESLRHLDRQFGEKIHRRDESVIAEIDRTYSGPLYGLLKDKLQHADIDSVIQESIFELWKNFRIDRGPSVRALLFQIARNKCSDVLRRTYRQRELIDRKCALARTTDLEDHDGPVAHLEAREKAKADRDVLELVETACNSLSERQATAFRRRFLSGAAVSWAKELEEETQISAKNWRKYSDDAKKNVMTFLRQNGVAFSEGGRHEVA